MKFLENQTSLSTVHISLYENKVIVPNLEDGRLKYLGQNEKTIYEKYQHAISWPFRISRFSTR